MFQPVEGSANFPSQEEAILEFWKEHGVYQQSLDQRHGCRQFVFYEGPPTANGMPHPGHCLTRAIKDLFPRYRTMRGYHCERKAGWDTHGLPVEVEVCKELGIHSKEEIEQYGVEPFIQKCQQSVWRYMQQWETLTERLGFWVNLDEAYVTYHQSYVESVWWSLKQLFDRGLLYQGHKIVWWWAQGGTALSAGEVGQGYRQVADPSVFVRFPLLDDDGGMTDTSLLVWTTTPWTLPSNQFAAVHPELEYADVRDPQSEGRLIIAADLVETIAAKVKRELEVVSTIKGNDLVRRRYVPPFDYYYADDSDRRGTLVDGGQQHIAWRIVAADFVTTDSGSGVVHQAPAFGEIDYDVLQAEQARFKTGQGPRLICAVGPDGKFTAEAPEYEGRWVKDCDKDITRELKQRGLLYHQEQYLHDYPFCWRAEDDPLIQYPRESWFIRTKSFKDELVANNREVNWLPDHIRDGRMGKFLESNVDWALSRERYWGTPLPVWQCDDTGYQEAVGNYEELLAKPGVQGTEFWQAAKEKNRDLPDDLQIHKPYVDEVTYDSPNASGARMRRVPEVIDCWYDSGAMPFSQWGYRGETEGDASRQFRDQFPADFISEALDQTRGWFYSQLAISTLLFGPQQPDAGNPKAGTPYPHPFRTCIVLGLLLGEDGQKMSKSKRNYREPKEIFDRYGADAMRWYFFSTQPPWTTIRYSEQAIKESVPEFLLRLWNVYSFFIVYANIDGFDPAKNVAGEAGSLAADVLSQAAGYRPIAQRSELDRWVLSELHRTTAAVIKAMDEYDNFVASQHLHAFVDALSNWYVRRSRDRFWMSDKQAPEKMDAYWTLYECLLTVCKLAAPFVPFVTESIWQNLAAGAFDARSHRSVHLCDFPESDTQIIDEALSTRMGLVREISSLGRAARGSADLKVRQPLAKVEVVLATTQHVDWLRQHGALIEEELNVKAVEFTTDVEEYITYTLVPNFKRLGPRLGKNMPVVKKLLGERDANEVLQALKSGGTFKLDLPEREIVELDNDDVEVRLEAKKGWSAAQGKHCVVVLDTRITEELLIEGIARSIARFANEVRKAENCRLEQTIAQVHVVSDEPQHIHAAQVHAKMIQQAALAENVTTGSTAEYAQRLNSAADDHGFKIDGNALFVLIDKDENA